MSYSKFAYRLNGSLSTIIPVFGVVFDLDGTLTIPVLNFTILRKRLNISSEQDILGYVNNMPLTDPKRTEAMRIIENFEEEGRKKFALQPGVNEMLDIFSQNNIKLALITRNDHRAVEQFLQHLRPEFQDGKIFTHILTRDFKPPKPDPAALFHICKKWEVDCCSTVFVGDHRHDMECGKKAGAATVLLNNPSNTSFQVLADHNVDSLMDLVTDLQSHSIVKTSVVKK